MSIHVLLYGVNDYNQYGMYYHHAWDHKPTREELYTELNTFYRSGRTIEYFERGIDNLLAGLYFEDGVYQFELHIVE